ncbi:MAG: metal ABC transporter ATP-binding protein [Leptolyngbyaceae cyanobacterium T60_A2020_046]|nr:metal ABC transporter ATP-binding protein [Leptolyngbyaceae cyanobacterium T60_A2020_046]
MLDIENLSVNYQGVCALDGVSLTLRPGEMVGLIGPNGAGKSTLIKAILGLVRYRGRIELQGVPLRRQRQRMAYVPQRSQIDWDYPATVWTVALMSQTAVAGWLRRPSQEQQARVRAALARVGMDRLRHRPISQLSGGQQQRVFLARALAQHADIFLLDEPFTGIDKKTEAIMLEVFDALRAEGKTLLVSCHEWGEALNRYDRLLLLNGRLLADDTPQAVMTMENIRQAYGEAFQPERSSPAHRPFAS